MTHRWNQAVIFWLRKSGVAAVMLLLLAFAGCASQSPQVDPWEQGNRFFYKVDDGLDKVVLKPLSDLYVAGVPKPLRDGLGNGFTNLGYFNVILNDFLQGNTKQGWSDAGRMTINSTLGIAGVFDVAGRWGMVSHDNDFGITLGKWGAPAGPYLVLPLFGPSTFRDAPGIGVGMATDPTTYLDLPLKVAIPLFTTEAIDARSRAEQELKFRNAAAIDPYVFTRDAYLQYRAGQIHPGAAPPTTQKSIYDEDLEENPPATQPAAPPTTGPAAVPVPATQPATRASKP